ncbi:hypothetical protein [Bacillus cereus]
MLKLKMLAMLRKYFSEEYNEDSALYMLQQEFGYENNVVIFDAINIFETNYVAVVMEVTQ